jgi:hypothetical protein
MRFVVFDDFLAGNDRGWMADNFAAELRLPLRAIGVRVVRQRGPEGYDNRGGFRARGHSAKVYKATAEKVRNIVDRVLSLPAPRSRAALSRGPS